MIDTTLIAKLQADHEERLLYWKDHLTDVPVSTFPSIEREVARLDAAYVEFEAKAVALAEEMKSFLYGDVQ